MPANLSAEQCEGCTWCATSVAELSYLHSRDITFAVFCQGPFEESISYHDFMGWEMPWYSALPAQDTLLVGRHVGMMHLVCYLRDGDHVFETYWTTLRGVEIMDYSYALMDLTVWGRQEPWQDSPVGWPQPWTADEEQLRTDGRPDPAVVPAGSRPLRRTRHRTLRVGAGPLARPAAEAPGA